MVFCGSVKPYNGFCVVYPSISFEARITRETGTFNYFGFLSTVVPSMYHFIVYELCWVFDLALHDLFSGVSSGLKGSSAKCVT